MARVNGLLLRRADGTCYFIEGGIKAHKIAGPGETDRFLGCNDKETALLKRLLEARDGERKPENSPDGAGTDPVSFVAYNVWVDVPDAGDVVTAGSSTNYSGH